jgi:phosphotransferase system enzyme I (PtsI)
MTGQLKGERVFSGIAVSAGVCRGKVIVLHRARHMIARRELLDTDIASEIKRFEQALVKTRQQITEVQRRVAETMSSSEADIFDAHLLMLEDRMLIEEVQL